MRIAQIAPLWESVPPKTYGGTELVVHLISEELIRRGHEVTLFASGDSETQGNLCTCVDTSLRNIQDQSPMPPIMYELRLLEQVFSQADQFDVIHNHLGFQALPFACLTQTPVLTTLHGVFEPPPIRQFIDYYQDQGFVSISDYQRKPMPGLNYLATVYHGIILDQYLPAYDYTNKNYLAFLGRFSIEKGPHHAIHAAKETGWTLIMAGKVDAVDEDYFKSEIAPHIDGKQIQYIGEVNHLQKVNLLRHAAATLCPVTWPEPFGLVLIESMACGTPVIAMRNGSIPEVIAHGETGYVVDSYEAFVAAIAKIPQIDRRICRDYVESRFSVERMVDDYLALYHSLMNQSSRVNRTPSLRRSYSTSGTH